MLDPSWFYAATGFSIGALLGNGLMQRRNERKAEKKRLYQEQVTKKVAAMRHRHDLWQTYDLAYAEAVKKNETDGPAIRWRIAPVGSGGWRFQTWRAALYPNAPSIHAMFGRDSFDPPSKVEVACGWKTVKSVTHSFDTKEAGEAWMNDQDVSAL